MVLRSRIPVSCTLPEAAIPPRIEHWRALARAALERRRVPGGVELTLPPDRADEVRELASLECDCCGHWMEISIAQAAPIDPVVCRIVTEADDGRDVIERLVGPDV